MAFLKLLVTILNLMATNSYGLGYSWGTASNGTAGSIINSNISFSSHRPSGYTDSPLLSSSSPLFHASDIVTSWPTPITPKATNSSRAQLTTTSTDSRSGGYNLSETRLTELRTSAAISSVLTQSFSSGAFSASSYSSDPFTSVSLTSTLTSAPSDFSTEATTNTAWLVNTWLTTRSNGRPTIVPVIVGCPNCGGPHGGIILWNLPEIPNIKFRFPNFPNLPEFHLPCVKIFGMALNSACSRPPVVDSDDLHHSKNPSQSYSFQSKPTQSQKSRTQPSLSPTATSTLCSSHIISDCLIACSAMRTLGSTLTSCYSTNCYRTITACSTTGTTSSSIASVATSTSSFSRYLIFTAEGVSQDQINDLNSVLMSELGPSNTTQISLNSNSSVFVAVMNSSIVSYLRGNPTISLIAPDSYVSVNNRRSQSKNTKSDQTLHYEQNKTSNITLFKRTGIPQEGAVPELRFISQPKGIPVSNTLDYIWVEGGGRDVNVYVVDSGAYTGNSEFYDMPGEKRWLKSTLTDFPLQLEETDETGHGSCVNSKVSGPRFGVAKNANITIAKFVAKPGGEILFSSILDTLHLTCQDVETRGLQGKAVVNLSWEGYLNESNNGDRLKINALRLLIERLLKHDVVVVVASGNLGENPEYYLVDTYPALLQEVLTDIIVVGSVDLDGSQSSFSKGNDVDDVDVLAPGNAIRCASNLYNGWSTKSGTSLAAPAVAGLAACFLSSNPSLQVKGLVAQKVKRYIVNLAWSRNSGPLALWNGENSSIISCNEGTARQKKRDSAACSADRSSASISDLFSHSSTTAITSPSTNITSSQSRNSVLLPLTGSTIPNSTTYSAPPPPIRTLSSANIAPFPPSAIQSTDLAHSIKSTQPSVSSRASTSIPQSNSSFPKSNTSLSSPSTLLSIHSVMSNIVPVSTTKSLSSIFMITSIQSSSSRRSSPEPTSTGAPLPQPPPPSNQISIFYSSGCDDTVCYAKWYIYATTIGGSVDVCNYYFAGNNPLFQLSASLPDSNGDIPYASSLGPFDNGNYQNCRYTGTSFGGGSLTCDGFESPAVCLNFANSSFTPCANGEGTDTYYTESYCQF